MLAKAGLASGLPGYAGSMSPDAELMVIFGALHVVALLLGGVLFYMFLRSESTTSWQPPEEDEGGGGGGNDRRPIVPKPRPTGGVPLLDAVQASRRLRGPGTLRDAHPRPARRPAHPVTPVRRPVRRV
jgi:hypothetical protein